MSNKFKKLIVNPWLIAILSPIVTTYIVAIVKNIKFLDAIKVICNFIQDVLNYKISLKFNVLFILILFIIIKIYIKIVELKKDSEPLWLNYTKDTYGEWYFSWEYEKHYNNYSIENIHPICRCGCSLSKRRQHNNMHYGNGVLVCPKCDACYESISDETISDFEKILYHNIETNNYDKCI